MALSNEKGAPCENDGHTLDSFEHKGTKHTTGKVTVSTVVVANLFMFCYKIISFWIHFKTTGCLL